MDLSLGWRTDLTVLRLQGSEIEDRGDHLVVTTPTNPSYYWGNFVLVTDPAAIDQPERWLTTFEASFPAAGHRSIGLVAPPADPGSWAGVGLDHDPAEVLVAEEVAATPLAAGYQVRPIDAPEDWARSTRLRQAAYPGQDDHEERTTHGRIGTRGSISWFGAFHADDLVAELGIVSCGDGVARYQSVLTHPDHRRRGLVRHLLGVAACHARNQGAGRLVIVADTGSDAERLYRSAGFTSDSTAHHMSRTPPSDQDA